MLLFCRFKIYHAAILAIAACILWNGMCTSKDTIPGGDPGPDRIISLAPSITETLFALGLGKRVVGVTSYCHYPPSVDSIEKIGGYSDANLEKIVSLNPDIVILQHDHEKQRTFLKRSGIRVLAVNYRTIAAVCSSFALIGRNCGAEKRADSLIALFDSSLQIDTALTRRPRTLLCVGRETPGSGSVGSIFAAGAGTFYNDIIRAAGGINVIRDSLPQYPRLSREGIIACAPEVIIDIAHAMEMHECSLLVKDWRSVRWIPAVEDNRVYCLSREYASIPGPRVPLLLDDFAQFFRSEKH
ncbi:MAG: ABC transporter substrate-binding protein [Chitinivibrionales bacterium]|nr:ABC transporter substrate-binding protein [Chitinivibrionales bacterium]